MSENTRRFHGAKWAPFRFGVVKPLLSSPPAKGELQTRLQELAGKKWLPPGYGIPVTIGALDHRALVLPGQGREGRPHPRPAPKGPQDQGEQWSLSEPLRRALCAQHRAHKRWSYQLHWDNLLFPAFLRRLAGRLAKIASTTLTPLPSVVMVKSFEQSSPSGDLIPPSDPRIAARPAPWTGVDGFFHLGAIVALRGPASSTPPTPSAPRPSAIRRSS